MKYKGNLDTPSYLKVVNENGFTLACCNCTVHNGECADIAKNGKCRCFNSNEGLRRTLKKMEEI